MWVLVVNTTANRLSSTQDLLGDGSQVLTERLLLHLSGNLVDSVQWNVTAVLDVLLLFTVSWWLLQSSDDKRRGRWHHGGGGSSVSDSQSHGNLDTLEVFGGLGDVFTDLLWGQTQRTNLWGQCGGGTDLTTDGSQVDELDFRRIKLWRHIVFLWVVRRL